MFNEGLVSGGGRVEGAFTNIGGELHVGLGQQLKIDSSASNDFGGQVILSGGTLWVGETLSSISNSLIMGNGSLRADGGITNVNSTMAFSGAMNVNGDVDNQAGMPGFEDPGLIVVSGVGPTTFLDDVNNDGEIYVREGSTATYFGAVTGSGSFTGSGTNNFEGDLRPGSSPAVLTFEGSVGFGRFATLQIELGGRDSGQYDALDVGGNLELGGTLQVVLIDEFTPQAGDTFDILDWGELGPATFIDIELPELSGRMAWDTSDLYTTGQIVAAGMLIGDTDVDWDVDCDDYDTLIDTFGDAADWRTDFNEDGVIDIEDFALQRAHYGEGVSPSGELGGPATTTPEPASIILLGAGAAILLKRKARK